MCHESVNSLNLFTTFFKARLMLFRLFKIDAGIETPSAIVLLPNFATVFKKGDTLLSLFLLHK